MRSPNVLRMQLRGVSAVASMREIISGQLHSIKEAGTWKNERVITSAQKGSINIENSDRKVLNFCANNYLGLSVSAGSIFCFLTY